MTYDSAFGQNISDIVKTLVRGDVLNINPTQVGGNNKIYFVEMKAGEKFALKFYENFKLKAQDRLNHEFSALKLLAEKRIKNVPLPIVLDPTIPCGLYSWVDGCPAIDSPNGEDTEQFSQFLSNLFSLGLSINRSAMLNGVGSIFSPMQAVQQLDNRLNELRSAVEASYPAVRLFVDNELAPAIHQIENRMLKLCEEYNIHLFDEITDDQCVPSPSDIGLHNALRLRSGEIYFIDFEYFGWDDPVKLVSDIIFHPGSGFGPQQRKKLVEDLTLIYAKNDVKFLQRLDALHPVFGAIWCLIILNVFLPSGRERYLFTGRRDDLEEYRSVQLEKSRDLYKRIAEYVRL